MYWAYFLFRSLLGVFIRECTRCILTMEKVLPSYYAKAAACYSFHFTAFIVTGGDRSKSQWNGTSHCLGGSCTFWILQGLGGHTWKDKGCLQVAGITNSHWDSNFQIVKRQTLFFRKALKLPGQTGAKGEAGPKNISLSQKCPHVLTLPKECLLVCVST